MEDTNSQNASSRSPSPAAGATDRTSISVPEMPRPVKQFFEAIPQQGFPAPKAKPQSQPWKAIWGGIEGGIEQPFGEGKLIVACPKIATYGSNNNGGL